MASACLASGMLVAQLERPREALVLALGDGLAQGLAPFDRQEQGLGDDRPADQGRWTFPLQVDLEEPVALGLRQVIVEPALHVLVDRLAGDVGRASRLALDAARPV